MPARFRSCCLAIAIAATGGSLLADAGNIGDGGLPPTSVRPRHASDRAATVLIELASPSAAVAYARSLSGGAAMALGQRADAAAQASAIAVARAEAEQAPILAAFRSGGIEGRLLYSITRAANGIAAELDPSEIERVRALPNVRRVTPLRPMALDLVSAVPLVGASAVWNPSIGVRGEGVRIGIIDTGVDYFHADLGGAGVYSRVDYTVGNVPWTSKIVGGIDLAGDDYDGSSNSAAKRTPKPDPDPMDCNGHGTHVSGIASGLGVLKNGTTYPGPWNGSLDASAFRIGPGVAPAAQLYAIRVFGCSGQTYLVPQAIDWALDPNRDGSIADHLDVVNLSLGSPYGPASDAADMEVVDNAVLAGMIVVASAGNSGDSHFIVGSPATATRAVAVAASADSGAVTDAITVSSPSSVAGPKAAVFSSAYDWARMTGPVTGSLVYPASQRSGCGAFDGATTAQIAGKIALLDWTDNDCKSAARVKNAANAGAIGVVIAYHDRFDVGMAGSPEIPGVFVTKGTADALKAAMPVTMTFDASLRASLATVDDALTDTVPGFSSRGPRSGDNVLKPDIAAPGETIFSGLKKSGNAGQSESGTSMSAPMVAGAMALLRQLHPSWSVEQLKALAMNSATHDLYSGTARRPPLYSAVRVGSGRLDLAAASTLDLLAYAADPEGSVGVSFGMVEVPPAGVSVERQFRLVNKSPAARAVTLSYTPVTSASGVSLSFPDGTAIQVPASGSATARIRLTADAANMKHGRDATSDSLQATYGRTWVTEAAGTITVTPATGQALRLPVHAIVRPASKMTAGQTSIKFTTASGSSSIALKGNSVLTGTSQAPDWESLVTPFELAESRARNEKIPAATNLRYVGVTSNYRVKSSLLADTTLYFAIALWGPWGSPNEIDLSIRFDVNGDGKSEFETYPTNVAWYSGVDSGHDVPLVATCSFSEGTCVSRWLNGYNGSALDTAAYNTDVMKLPVPVSKLGLTAGNSRFNYYVVLWDPGTGEVLDVSRQLTFDPAHAPNLFGTSSDGMLVDAPATAITVNWADGDFANGSRGLLLLHFLNATGSRAEVLPWEGTRMRGARR